MKKNQGVISIGARGEFYEIHIKGQLDESWSEWLEGLDVKLFDNSGCLRKKPEFW